MTAIEVSVNGRRQCVVGISKDGVVTAMVHWVGRGKDHPHLRREDVTLHVSGLDSKVNQHVDWVNRDLKAGDEIVLRIVSAPKADKPKEKKKVDPVKARRHHEAYVRGLVKDLGWKLFDK